MRRRTWAAMLFAVMAAASACDYPALPPLSGAPPPDAPPGARPDAHVPQKPPADAATCGAPSVCVEAPQAPWNGPVIFFEGTISATPPTCPGGYPMFSLIMRSGLDGGNASCTCSCGPPTRNCGSAVLEDFQDTTCTTGFGDAVLQAGVCTSLTGRLPYLRLVVGSSGGKCTASVTKNFPMPTWNRLLSGCAGNGTFTGAGCGGGELCVPRPSAPFDPQICIYTSGDVPCPTGSAYSSRIVGYSGSDPFGFDDTRDCSPCSCGTPTGTCSGYADLTHGTSSSGGCGSTVDQKITAGSCDPATGSPTHAIFVSTGNLTCTPSTSTVTGSVSATDPALTLCCTTP